MGRSYKKKGKLRNQISPTSWVYWAPWSLHIWFFRVDCKWYAGQGGWNRSGEDGDLLISCLFCLWNFFFLYVLIGMNESLEDQIFQTNQWSPLVQFWLQSSQTVSWSPRAIRHGVTFQIKVKSKWRWKGKVWGPSTASLVGNHPLSINTSNGRKSQPHFMKLHCRLTRNQSAPFPRTALQVLETVFSSPPRVSDSYLESRESEGTAILLDNISFLEQPRLGVGGFSCDAVMLCWGEKFISVVRKQEHMLKSLKTVLFYFIF